MAISIFLYVIIFTLACMIFNLSINYENEAKYEKDRYYFINIFMSILFSMFIIYFYKISNINSAYEIFVYTLLFSTLFALSIIDYKYGILPDKINFIAFVITLVIVIIESFDSKMTYLNVSGMDRIIAVTALLLVVVLLIVTKSDEKIGGGDIKLLLWASLALGWKYVFVGLMAACVMALVYHVLLRLIKKSMNNEIRFGPFLSVGFAIAVCNGDYLFNRYLVLVGIL